MNEPLTDEVKSIVRNRRTDAMFVAAYLMVAALIYVVVNQRDINEYGQGVITLALGTFMGYLTAMYQFETGTTRASAAKDAALTVSKEKSDTALIEIAKATPAPAANGKPLVTPAPAQPDGTIPAASAIEVQPPKGTT